MAKNIGVILIIAGCLALLSAILLAFAMGGRIVPILTVSSILLNSAGITLIRESKKR